jgi:hypothetical protein
MDDTDCANNTCPGHKESVCIDQSCGCQRTASAGEGITRIKYDAQLLSVSCFTM